MHGAKKPPHLLHKRARGGGEPSLAPVMPGGGGIKTFMDGFRHLEPQDRPGRDNLDVDIASAATSAGSDALIGLQDVPTKLNTKQLTSTEYALQEIRNRVRVIDERWEEVNVRATHTLDNIEEDDRERRDPDRRRKGSATATGKQQRDAPGVNRKLSLRGNRGDARVDLTQREAGLRDVSHAAAWLTAMGDSGRAVTRDERVAMALAQSHENLAAAAVQFEESQERSSKLLGGLRGWFDGFTGTARPEDINPIAAMLPEPGLESEVVALMTDCQDAALMLETATNRHTGQLKEIFAQAGKLYGTEIDRAQKKGSEVTVAAREKITDLQEHANNVEKLLNSMQEENGTLQSRFQGAEQRCRWLEERYRGDKAKLQEGLSTYMHRVKQLQQVVAGYEDKARRQEQVDREPRLAPILDKLNSPQLVPNSDSGQTRQLQAESNRLSTENAALTEANKKLHRELVVLRLADHSGKRAAGRQASVNAPDGGADPAVEEMLRNAKERSSQAEKALLETKEKERCSV